MKHSFLLLVFILSFASPILSQNSKSKVAVYMTGEVENSYKKVIGSKLVSAITSRPEYAAVERTSDFLSALSSEYDYQISGEVRDSQIARLGQQFGVRYVLVADISELFQELFVSARLIDVETALIMASTEVNGKANTMQELNKISVDVATGLFQKQGPKLSKTPKHLSLCILKEGELMYVTQDEWMSFSQDDRSNYYPYIKGVCFFYESSQYVVEMANHTRSYKPSQYRYIDGNRVILLYKFKYQLNQALRCFGGMQIEDSIYWTNRMSNSQPGRYYTVNMRNGENVHHSQSSYNNFIIRRVYRIEELR